MKSLLFSLALLLSLLPSRADFYHYTGAWYETVAPRGAHRIGGQIDMEFSDDGSLEAVLSYDGFEIDDVIGDWNQVRIAGVSYVAFVFYDSDGWRWSGKIKSGSELVLGTFASPTRAFRGNFQLNNPN